MDKQSALAILGLGADATRTEAKKAYRQMAKRCHPDRFSGRPGAVDAEIRMKRLNAAFSFLVKVLPDRDAFRDNERGAEPESEKSTSAGKKVRSSGKGFFSAFGEGLRAMAGPKRKRPPSTGKTRVSPGRGEGTTRRTGQRTLRKKAPQHGPGSFEDILRENSSGKGLSTETSRVRPAAPAGDPYARYVKLRQHLRMQRRRSRQGGVSRVEKVTPVSPVPRVGDDS